jgi:hypothetical protein
MSIAMLRQLVVSSVVLASATLVQGQTPAAESSIPVAILEPPNAPRHRFTLSYRMGLNITADFKRLGGFTPLSNPGAAAGGAEDRTYDNGYNLVDITGNDHGPGFENTTWNWGYSDPGAVQGNTMVLSSSSSPSDRVSKNNTDDPQNGLEVGYSRQFWQNGKWRFGLEGALGYTQLSVHDSHVLNGTIITTTDTFVIPDGVVLPPTPYAGTYEGPGPVISSDPFQRETVVTTETTTITGRRKLESTVYGLRLGPYAQLPLNDRFSLFINTGLYLAVGDTRFTFNETVVVDDVGTQSRAGSGSQTDFLVGAYFGGNIEYALTEEVGLFVGAQFQTAGRSINQEDGKTAILDMGQAVIVSVGASYSF